MILLHEDSSKQLQDEEKMGDIRQRNTQIHRQIDKQIDRYQQPRSGGDQRTTMKKKSQIEKKKVGQKQQPRPTCTHCMYMYSKLTDNLHCWLTQDHLKQSNCFPRSRGAERKPTKRHRSPTATAHKHSHRHSTQGQEYEMFRFLFFILFASTAAKSISSTS